MDSHETGNGKVGRRNFLISAVTSAGAVGLGARKPREGAEVQHKKGPTQPAKGGKWIRPHDPHGALIWGRSDGVVFGLPSPGGLRGPYGLIRIGIFNAKTQTASLVNFVAIEPVIFGPGSRLARQGFSELGYSHYSPGHRGKRLWVPVPKDGDLKKAIAGTLRSFPVRPTPVEELTVRIEVERYYANQAHVYLEATMESDRPREVAFRVYQHKDSVPIEELTLTATMGSYERLRYLWLKRRIIDSRVLFRGYRGSGFVEQQTFPIEEMLRTWDGDAIALCTTNERDPSAVQVSIGHWTYKSVRLTQYWRVPHHDIQPDLRVRVNGRRTYYRSKYPIPDGTTFENFEVRQRYVDGQRSIFGLTPEEPGKMRIANEPPAPALN